MKGGRAGVRSSVAGRQSRVEGESLPVRLRCCFRRFGEDSCTPGGWPRWGVGVSLSFSLLAIARPWLLPGLQLREPALSGGPPPSSCVGRAGVAACAPFLPRL
jgi:hypothetical protein